jgi:L-2-hydroxyglutarate oxidase
VSDRLDVAVIGGGIVGLAAAHRLLGERPQLRLAVVEKEDELARHQSGHNSGVLHAGLYYAPGSLKATLCKEGKAQIERFAESHGIPVRHPGKLVLAVTEAELPRLEALLVRAQSNAVPGLEVVGPERIRELEPEAAGLRGVWSPSTGIVDFRAVALALADEVRAQGGTIVTGCAITGIAERGDGVVLSTASGELDARHVISCAGLHADRVAAMTGDRGPGVPHIVPFRGDYYRLAPGARHLVTRLVYPVPDPRFPFLGVHFTPRIDGEVWAGPNAVLAFAREGYRRRDLDLRDLVETLTYRGFLRLARRHFRTGLSEFWRDWSKRAFFEALQQYIPRLRPDQLEWGPSGVRAQALAIDGTLVDDFDFGGSTRILHVRNAPSPAATASLAIGGVLAGRAVKQFGLA